MTSTLGPLLASGNVAEVHAWRDGQVLKLYKPAPWAKRAAFREAANQAAAEAMGLPVPAMHGVIAQGERWGIIFDRVEGSSFAQRMLADAALVPGHLEALIDLQLRLQRSAAPFFTGLKQRLASHIGLASQLGSDHKHALLAGLQAMPDGDRLCHFDFHPMNVLGPVDRRPYMLAAKLIETPVEAPQLLALLAALEGTAHVQVETRQDQDTFQ